MKTDFHIDVIPVSISLECPHCDSDIVLNWKDIYVPGYWGGGDWGTVECPACGKDIELGDYEYDQGLMEVEDENI